MGLYRYTKPTVVEEPTEQPAPRSAIEAAPIKWNDLVEAYKYQAQGTDYPDFMFLDSMFKPSAFLNWIDDQPEPDREIYYIADDTIGQAKRHVDLDRKYRNPNIEEVRRAVANAQKPNYLKLPKIWKP